MTRLGVVGAGVMGAGIAQVGVLAGMETMVHDPVPAALDAGLKRVRDGLANGAASGRWTGDDARAAASRLHLAVSLDVLADCDLVIEAAPEDLEIKRALFDALEDVCRADAVLATNTSSIPVTAIAARVRRPAHVVGMHFFNPVTLMALVEVIPGMQTSEATVETAKEAGHALGKQVIVARDGPGFLVNRCGRPFYGEALRLLAEQVAGVEQIDRICRLGGGFRLGPFELMDLVGIDVSFAVARSFAEVSYGEPRWRPSPLHAVMAESGRLGRKTGHGWYAYRDGPHRADDPVPPKPAGAAGRPLAVIGTGAVAERLRTLASQAGFAISDRATERGDVIFADDDDPQAAAADVACPIVACASRSLASRPLPRALGFNLLSAPAPPRLVEMTRTAACTDEDASRADLLFRAMGLHVEWVRDAPGLVLGRIVAQIVNEACFAVGEGVASPGDVDAGVRLGLNYPIGPFAWGAALGWETVARTVDGIWQERREERYRLAPLLLRAASSGDGAIA